MLSINSENWAAYFRKALKWDARDKEIYKIANRNPCFITRNSLCKMKDIVLSLYNTLVRPHLEFAVKFWYPPMMEWTVTSIVLQAHPAFTL